jgi:hypothetical protein
MATASGEKQTGYRRELKTMTSNDMKKEKKVYHSPRLIVYGNVRELTESGGTTGNPDGKDFYGNEFRT